MRKDYIRDGRAPIPIKASTSKVMSANKAKDTSPELALRKKLWSSGIRGYRLHWKQAAGRPDVCFPGWKIAIFVNGCFWHRCPHCRPPFPRSNQEFWSNKFAKNLERDDRKVQLLENNAWKVIVLWECQVKSNIDDCILIVRRHLQV